MESGNDHQRNRKVCSITYSAHIMSIFSSPIYFVAASSCNHSAQQVVKVIEGYLGYNVYPNINAYGLSKLYR